MLTILGFFGKGMKVLTSFLGIDKTLAQTQIVSEGFTVGTVTQSDSTDSAEGPNHNKVISQSPPSLSLIDYDSPINITWRNFSFTPAAFSFTPAPPFSFTPAPPFSFTPAPFSFTPAPPAFSFTPAPEKYYSYAYCEADGTPNGYSVSYLSISGYSTVAEACSATQSQLAPYGITNFTCIEGTQFGPMWEDMVTCSKPSSYTVPDVVGLTSAQAQSAINTAGFTTGSFSTGSNTSNPANAGKVQSQSPAGLTLVTSPTSINLVMWNYAAAADTKNTYTFTFYDGKCNYSVHDYLGSYIGAYSTNLCVNSGTDASGAAYPNCSNANCTPAPSFSFTPAPPFSFTPAPPFSFTPAPPFSFTPEFSFTPAPPEFSFTPAFSFAPESTGCRAAKPQPYCFCMGTQWLC